MNLYLPMQDEKRRSRQLSSLANFGAPRAKCRHRHRQPTSIRQQSWHFGVFALQCIDARRRLWRSLLDRDCYPITPSSSLAVRCAIHCKKLRHNCKVDRVQ